MAIYRIAILGATFFLVALSPRFDMALAVMVSGVFVYLTLWCRDIVKRKGKQ